MEPIYRSDGEWVAVYHKGQLFSREGEWIGFVVGRDLFDPDGKYVGFLSDDRRLLRKRVIDDLPVEQEPPAAPSRPRIPSRMPLAPLMRSLPYHIVDIFEEFPERFEYIDETRPDME